MADDFSWKTLDKYFSENSHFITKHHLDSYNDFVVNKIPNTIKTLNPFIMIKENKKVYVYIGGRDGSAISLTKPTIVDDDGRKLMFPNEARLKDYTYTSDLYATILVEFHSENQMIEKEYTNIKIGSIPIMLHSCLCALNGQSFDARREIGECPYDQGGYFVIDGKEKVIVAQERIATNRVFINQSKDYQYSYEALIRSTSEESPLFPKTIMFFVYKDQLNNNAALNSFQQLFIDDEVPTAKPTEDSDEEETEEEKKEKRIKKFRNAIVLTMPNLQGIIPICILFRALGVESDLDIIRYIAGDEEGNAHIAEFLRFSIIYSFYNYGNIVTQEDALIHLSKLIKFKDDIKAVKYFLIHDLFPNVGPSFKKKAMFLGSVILKLVKVCIGHVKESNRDSYMFKRVDISGFLMGNLFRDYYNQFRNNIRNELDRQYLISDARDSPILKNFITLKNFNIIFRSDIIENGLKKSLKGKWGHSMVEKIQNPDLIKDGIVQDLSRFSYLGTISHMRRVNTPIDPTTKLVEPHRLDTTQWGVMCPCESPDGGSIGLLKNMAIMCHITFDYKTSNISQTIADFNKHCQEDECIRFLEFLQPHETFNITKIMINSTWIGVSLNPVTFYKHMKLCKRNAYINTFTSISWNVLQNELNILTEAGRCCRPLFVVDDGNLVIRSKENLESLKWLDLLSGGKKKFDPLDDVYINVYEHYKGKDIYEEMSKTQAPIEYIDIEEANCSLIAITESDITKNTTHCEIHPSTIFSVVTHTIPFANSNPGPRNTFSGAQGKQAIGWYASNFNNRIDTMAYMLYYPQKCIVNTRYIEHLNLNRLPNGENLIVAICTYMGYNQEDSIMMNQSSVERGMFNLTYFKNLVEIEEEVEDNSYKKKKVRTRFEFMNPHEHADKITKIKNANFNKLDENGFPKVNEYIHEGDVMIGKCSIKKETKKEDNGRSIFEIDSDDEEVYEDASIVADKTMSGRVDKVFVYKNGKGEKTCKIRFRKVKTPELGDKCCSKHAQKGVIGLLVPAHDMPFTKDGMVPDIIINPHAIPSRMTIGHLLECLVGKCGVMNGALIDGTPFCNYDFTKMFESLEKHNLHRHGDEVLYNGMTGEQLKADIFIGPTYYERLKHMSGEKINYRSTGPMTVNARQPTQGRGNLGGLRIGEMEMNVLCSHGLMSFMKESVMERSDNFQVPIDENTGYLANSKQSDAEIKIPYSMKQMMSELLGIGIKTHLNATKDEFVKDPRYDDDDQGIEEELRIAGVKQGKGANDEQEGWWSGLNGEEL